jgi:hypothetical protein
LSFQVVHNPKHVRRLNLVAALMVYLLQKVERKKAALHLTVKRPYLAAVQMALALQKGMTMRAVKNCLWTARIHSQ